MELNTRVNCSWSRLQGPTAPALPILCALAICGLGTMDGFELRAGSCIGVLTSVPRADG